MKNVLLLSVLPILAGLFVVTGILIPRKIHKLAKPQPPTILLYNHIVAAHAPGSTFTTQYPEVTAKNFDKQLSYLQSHHIQILDKAGYNATLHTKPSKPSVLLLFRNGYSDIATEALPILEKHHAAAVIFMVPMSENQPGYLTSDQIKTLQAHDISVALPNPVLLFDPNARNEVSGVISTPQFNDLLPQTTYTSVRAAIAIGLVTILVFAFALLLPEWAILLPVLLLPTYLIRFSLFGIPFTFLEVMLLVTILGVVIRRYQKIWCAVLSFSYSLPAALFILAALVSTYFAKDHAAALGGLKAYVLEPIAFAICLYAVFDTMPRAFRVLKVLLTSTVVIAIVSLVGFLLGDYYVTQNLEHTTTYFGNPNYLATFLAVGTLFAAFFFLFQANRVTRFVYAACFVLLIVPFLLAKSDTANLGVAAGLGLMVVYWLMQRIKLPKITPAIYILAAVLFGLAAFLAIENPHDQHFLATHHLGTLTSRFYIYQTAGRIIEQKPITGVGLNNFNQAYLANVSANATEQNVALAHNTLLDFWTQMGIFGLIAYVWIVIRYFRIGLLTKQNRLAVVLLSVLLALLMHGILDSQYHKNDYSLIFWTLVGLSAMLDRHELNVGEQAAKA